MHILGREAKCVKICGQDFQNEVSYDIKIQRQPISWEIFK